MLTMTTCISSERWDIGQTEEGIAGRYFLWRFHQFNRAAFLTVLLKLQGGILHNRIRNNKIKI